MAYLRYLLWLSVRQRNVVQGATFSMVVPDHVFEMASALWEPPDDAELANYDCVLPTAAAWI